MIQFQSTGVAISGRTILDGLDLELVERRIAILGANGSGKSTFARLINGLQLPTTGRVIVDGLDTKADAKAVRRKVGFVFQNPDNQIVLPTVEEDMKFGLQNAGLSAAEIEKRTDRLLCEYGLLELRHHPAHRLSGGQKQLLAIAGVLATEPDYIVLDEPTTLLDLRNRRRIQAIIRALPMTVIMVTHDLELAADFDRVIVLDDGRTIADGQPEGAIGRYVELVS